jgi:site-specific DNA recombinase
MRTIGYTRVSTDEQARSGISLETQRAKVEAYCQLNDLELVGILEDAGKSGKDLNREGMQQLLSMIKSRSVDAVVTYKLDRISRRVIDTLGVMELIEKSRIAFHSIVDQVNTKTATGRFVMNVMASMAQMERDLISERTRDALRMKVAKKERVGHVRYGYTLAADRKTLIENPREQEAIRLIAELHGKKYTLRAICRELADRGYQPIGKAWHAKTVMAILRRAA